MSVGDRVAEIVQRLDATSCVYAKNIATGHELAIDADRVVNAVSVIKLAIMVHAFRQHEAGRFDLDARYTLDEDDYRGGSGILQTFDPGLVMTYRDAVVQMIVTSDNTATDILLRHLDIADINTMLAADGYEHTRLLCTTGELFEAFALACPPDEPFEPAAAQVFAQDRARWLGQTTAREISRLLETIVDGEAASGDGCDEMLEILGAQVAMSRLPRLLEFSAHVLHKTGDWPPAVGNDVGILVHPGGPTVCSALINDNEGSFVCLEQAIGEIAKTLIEVWGTDVDGMSDD